jgi:hypothetical protein
VLTELRIAQALCCLLLLIGCRTNTRIQASDAALATPPAKFVTRIDSRLQSVIENLRLAGITTENAGTLKAGTRFSTPFVKVDDRARVQVYLEIPRLRSEHAAALSPAEIELTNVGLGLVQAWVPYEEIERISKLDFVVRVRPPDYGSR